MEKDSSQNNVFYICKGDSIFIKLINRLTALYSVNFKTFIKNIFIDNDDKINKLYVDLSETKYLDSTFMGVLLYIDNKSNERKKTFKIINSSKEALENLKSLGLEKILKIENREEKLQKSNMKEYLCLNVHKNTIFKSMLKSHILLSNINKNNKKEFCTLIRRLRKENNN
ncbi:STAS domain-containing protein [Borrelia anserina]|uniref:Sulfate transporter n=2 Tax=Borrelia anserina TaxID=143 RepID=A0ABM6FVC5_BORAN|nr:STAS domain-containing protein [Borrelia anserina]AHH08767.1 Putative STAS superfamily protein [Borrelia anserina BA2]APR65217.1 sulfate transporter [Borrelia anserina Es]UPA07140.1 STAS domain-containing protein [Borrelia anserina]